MWQNGDTTDATLVAPFDGIVTQTLVAPGAMVSSATPVVTLLGSSNEIAVNVEESRLGQLKAGMYAELAVTADEHTGLLVPRDAVTQRGGKDIVRAVVEGKAQMRQIVQGLPTADNVELLSGVKSDEQVIVVGYSGINDGDAVRGALLRPPGA